VLCHRPGFSSSVFAAFLTLVNFPAFISASGSAFSAIVLVKRACHVSVEDMHQLPLPTLLALAIVTALIVLFEQIWTNYQNMLESWWRSRRSAKLGREVGTPVMLNGTGE
jgi:hypothetical protein